MLVERRMNLPVEVVQQRRQRPQSLIRPELPRVRRDARLHGQRVLPQPLRLRVFAKNVPGLFAIEHSELSIIPAPHALTAWCFATHAGSRSTPNPGPVGTFILPFTTWSGDVLHSNCTFVFVSLNS